ncbi:hypothetical protein [Hippea alviniae]|uniref:hypothetical protein n=1 Tax=Hippea alviniae TaxID=1279027 RepID=UPI0003B4DD18|nr:hypothetical protein [Hippea alviniae]
MAKIWVRVDMVDKECYAGYIETFYENEDDDLLLVLEEQAYLGLKIDNVHRCKDVDGKMVVEPIDNEKSEYKDSIIIMNTDNILTIKLLKEDSDVVKEMEKRLKRESQSIPKNAKNVLKFRQIKKEKI